MRTAAFPTSASSHDREWTSKRTRLRQVADASIFGAAGLGAVLLLLATSKYGIAAISDSAGYVSAARSLAAGHGFVEWTGQPYVAWPPLYPALLAVFEAVGVDALVAARWVNAGLLAAITVLAGFALRDFNVVGIISALTAFSIALTPALLNEGIAVMSELLFVFLVLSCLVVLGRHLRRPSIITLLAASLCAALAWLTRYAGFTLVGTGALLLLARGGRSIAVSLREAAVFVVVAATPMTAWLARNHAVSGTTTGVRHESPSAFGALGQLALQRIGEWFVPPSAGPVAAVVIGGVILALALVVVTHAFVSHIRRLKAAAQWWETPLGRGAVVFASFVVTYLVALTWLSSLSWVANDPRRLVAPASVPVLMLLGILLAVGTKTRRRRWAIVASAFVMLLWPTRYAMGLVRYTRSVGAGGVASDRWRQSAVISNLTAYAAESPSARPVIYSNEPTAIYLLTDLTSVYSLPSHDNPDRRSHRGGPSKSSRGNCSLMSPPTSFCSIRCCPSSHIREP